MNIRRKLKAHAEVHTGPLNDILFILLLFFLIAATLANPNVIKLSQPKAKSDTKSKQTVVVSIDANKIYYVGMSVPYVLKATLQ
jgi:biopolymer transport protein ExbD